MQNCDGIYHYLSRKSNVYVYEIWILSSQTIGEMEPWSPEENIYWYGISLEAT